MLNKKKIRFVYTAFLKNRHGFTMISALFTLTIISLTLPLFIYLLQATTKETTNYDQLSVQHFFYFLQDELRQSTNYQIYDNRLYLQLHSDDRICFELQGNLIIRKVNNKGYEIYLREVDEITFSPLTYGVLVIVKTNEGKQYEKQIIHYP